jgi:hypothetical protein
MVSCTSVLPPMYYGEGFGEKLGLVIFSLGVVCGKKFF